MKKLILVLTLIIAALNIGYYTYLEDADPEKVFFIKKSLTLQIAFENIFANEGDHKKLHQLSEKERTQVIDYCRYRLGITTALKTEEELERCKEGQHPSEFR